MTAKKTKKKIKKYLILQWTLFLLIGFCLGGTASYFYFQFIKGDLALLKTGQQNAHAAFLLEVYDTIQENYWKKLSDAELVNIFKLGSEKLTGVQYRLEPKNKHGLELMLKGVLKDLGEDKHKEFSTKLASLVLTSLEPAGRSSLYTQTDKENLKNRVENIDPQSDLYEALGLEKDASQQEIEKVYQEKKAELELEKETSPEAEKKLEHINYAYNVLSDPFTKGKYDQLGAEPTVFSRLVHPDMWYLCIRSFSSSTFEEFQVLAANIDKKADPHTLILDLRNNVGGAIDILPYFLGPFVGKNQYIYEFYQQGEYIPYKTQTGWLSSLIRYKVVIVLINEKAQSSAEAMAAVLKKYNVGAVIGTTTQGWGTIEKVFELETQIDPDEKYSIFLVHALTLREDNQPIEGNGVEPLININDPDWEEQLLQHFHYPELVEKIKEIWSQDPADFY